MKIYAGKYGKDTIKSNSLAEGQLLFPQISSAIVRLYPQYSTAYFVDGTGRFAKEETIGNNKYQWFIEGRSNRPSTCTGTFSGTGVGLTQFSVEFEENYFNPNDAVRFGDGNQAVVLSEPTSTAGGYTFQFKLLTTDVLAAVSAASVAAGVTVGKYATVFPEGSKTGFENHNYPDLYTNYLGIQRKSRSITGSAATDIMWVESNGKRLWYFKDEEQCRADFMWEHEMDDWYSVSTMDTNGVCQVVGLDGKPLIKGDGILRQIDSSNTDTYSGVLTEKRISDFIAMLGLNTGMKSTHWLVYTGTAGLVAFAEAMKNFVMPNGNLIYNADAGKDMAFGGNFTTYYAFGHKITLVHNPIFDDKVLHGSNIDPISGQPKESFRMVFLNFGRTKEGDFNIERKVKGAGGVNRSMVTKYIKGMVDLFDGKSSFAANANDGFEVQMLRDAGIIVRNPLSCGELRFA